MRTQDEVNVWRTILTLGITFIIIITTIHLYNQFVKKEEEPLEEFMIDIEYLQTEKNKLITPNNKTLNLFTKNLNTTDHITIFHYLRENFSFTDPVERPRPPVETIERGNGSPLDLSLLYTSILSNLNYDAYMIIYKNDPVTIIFKDNIMYMFNWTFYAPLQIDSYSYFVDYDLVYLFSYELTRTFYYNFHTWVRSKL